MVKRLLLFMIFILICSVLVSAGPFRNISISVVDPFGVGVENAHVVMYHSHNGYFNNEGYTGPNGVVVFVDVDARVWMLIENNTQGNTLRGSGSSKPVIIKQNGYSNRIAVKESVSVMSQTSNNKNDKLSVIAVKESVKPEVNVVYRGSSNRDDRPDHVPMSLYHDMLFFFDISPYSGCTYNFIPQTYNRTFNFRNNPIELEFVVSDGSPIINLPESIIINEEDNHEIILNLEEYINDFESDFEDLTINIESSSWSEETGLINIVDDELIINFFPALDLDYHIDNTITFTISVEDSDSNYIEAVYTYEYETLYKALHGNVIDVYTYANVNDFNVIPDNGLDNIIYDNNEFIAFFNLGTTPKMQLLKNDYYESNRLINNNSNDDLIYDFSLVPVQYDNDYEGDWHEDGFSRIFRRTPTGGIHRWETEAIFCINDYDTYGYDPVQSDFDKVETTLGYINEFTNELMDPLDGDGIHLIYDQTGFCDATQNEEFGYDFIMWHPDLPSSGGHSETHATNGLTIIRAVALLVNENTPQVIYNQEILQTMGAEWDIDEDFFDYFGDYWPPGESTFCDPSDCPLPDEPLEFEYSWGKRAYMRPVGNTMPDNDPDPALRGNEYTEVITFYESYNRYGEKEILYKKEGYALANQLIKRADVLEELPSNAVLIQYELEGKEIRTKKVIKLNPTY